MNDIERQAERAMRRINESINRSAGQHIRAVRKAHKPVIDPTPPDAAECHEDDTGPESGMQMLVYLLIAVAVTAGAILLSFFITR